MPFTEFCCRSGGSNLNAGTRTGSSTEPGTSADLTYASGSWVNTTRVFTVASGDPVADGVAVGDFAAIDTGGATAAFIARVTARTSTTITLNSTGLGTNPANGTYTLRIGGAWQGPNGTVGFPFGQTTVANLTNVAGDVVRINMRGTFNISAAIGNWSLGSLVRVEGYTSTYADGGSFTLDGGTSGASYVLLAIVGRIHCKNAIFQNNGATGSSRGMSLAGANPAIFENCIFQDFRGFGLGFAAFNMDSIVINCVARRCNQSNTANTGGFQAHLGSVFHSCIATENTGSNSSGFVFTGASHPSSLVNCQSYGNGAHGLNVVSTGHVFVTACDFYNNGGSGISATFGSTYAVVTNSNFVKNAAWGINANNASSLVLVRNCGFGSGTAANASGTVNHPRPEDCVDLVTYPSNVEPWADAPNGNFAISEATAKGAGFGQFPLGSTTGYPDIGSAQSQATSGSAPRPRIVSPYLAGNA